MKPNISEKDFFEFYQHAEEQTENSVDAEGLKSTQKFERERGFPGGPALAVCIILGILAASAWLGYRIFSPPSTAEALRVTIDGPSEVASGNDAIYTLTISNQTGSPLEGVTVTARYPTGFSYVYSSREPLNANKNYWTLDPIEPHRASILTIRGSLVGLGSEEKNFIAAITYRQKGVSAEFSKTTTFSSRISSGGLVHRMSIPTSVQPGEQFSFTIQYDAFDSIPNADAALLSLTLPKGFKIISSQPQSDREGSWSGNLLLKTINPVSKKGEITLTGQFDQKTSGTFTVSSSIGVAGKKESEQTALVTVAEGTLSGTLAVNGSKNPATLLFDTPIAFTLTIENTGEEPVVEGVVSLLLESPLIQWTSLKDAHGGILSDHTITWSSREFQKLAGIEPGGRVVVPLSISLKNIADFRTLPDEIKSLDPFFLVATLTSQATLKNKKTEVRVLPVTVKNPISSDVAVNSSIAPIPPDSGKKAARVSWTITNTLHDLDAVSFTATLPQGVQWGSSETFDAGSITYDEVTRVVTWAINRIPKTVSSLAASFALSSAGDQWKETSTILDAIVFEATDKTTLSPIRIELGSARSEN